jgi:hypothetical protein
MMKRFIMRIELRGPAKKKLAVLSDRHGMTQVAMMSRLVEWYSAQNEVVQGSLMGHFPKEIEADVARLVLEKIAN